MKVIDLLNKIANGEHDFKFKYCDLEYFWDFSSKAFIDTESKMSIGERWEIDNILNDEVEIIEDKPFNERVEEIYNRHINYICGEEDKKIEKLTTSLIDIKLLTDEIDTKLDYSGDYDRLVNKINEIIDCINKEK